jgi:hypothetical protein
MSKYAAASASSAASKLSNTRITFSIAPFYRYGGLGMNNYIRILPILIAAGLHAQTPQIQLELSGPWTVIEPGRPASSHCGP